MIRKLALALAALVVLLALAAILLGEKTVNSGPDFEVAAWSSSGCVAATAFGSGDDFSDVRWGLANTSARRPGRPRSTPSERIGGHSSLIGLPESRYSGDSVASPVSYRVRTCVLRC
jgi:hypothetical protein